jgi:hypothetical protein
MKTRLIISIIVAMAVLMTTSLAFAKPWKGYQGSGGWGMNTPYQRLYNPQTVEILTGTVEAIDKTIPMKSMNYAIYIQLKTDKETIPVHLGPGWYIERLDTKIIKGDTIEVKGSRVTFADKPAIIAAEIKKADNMLILRDATGIPVWRGWRR